MTSKEKVSFAIIGAGSRGWHSYGKWIQDNPDKATVVAVAEPRDFARNKVASIYNIPAENVFHRWEQLLERPAVADAVIIATTDRMHTKPVILAAEKKYSILLEKPMAPTPGECCDIVDAVIRNNVVFAVCHVLRYAPFYIKIKEIIDSGQLGDICSVQHFEGIAWWHYAHSFVRGNFRNEAKGSFLLLAKSCHDMDVLRWWIGKKCLSVSSFGHLKHFRKENKPSQAAARCMDCPLADNKCPYSAKAYYFNQLEKGYHGWPLATVIDDFTSESLEHALRNGPYGRCVYQSDNDVVDSQVAIMNFEDQITANFTMSAFTPHGRMVRIMGSLGYLDGDEQEIKVLDFNSEKWTKYNVNELATDMTGGHGGGDHGLMKTFVEAVRTNDNAFIKTGPQATLESHLITFAAEKSRLENRVVDMQEMWRNAR